jgi:hypothetical protein
LRDGYDHNTGPVFEPFGLPFCSFMIPQKGIV